MRLKLGQKINIDGIWYIVAHEGSSKVLSIEHHPSTSYLHQWQVLGKMEGAPKPVKFKKDDFSKIDTLFYRKGRNIYCGYYYDYGRRHPYTEKVKSAVPLVWVKSMTGRFVTGVNVRHIIAFKELSTIDEHYDQDELKEACEAIRNVTHLHRLREVFSC